MNAEIDNFVSSLKRRLFWMSPGRRCDIAKEVKSHLEERINSGESVASVISSFGDVKEVSKDYMRIYGFGGAFLAALAFAGTLIAVLSVPAIYMQTPDITSVTWISLGFLAIAILLTIVTSALGGRISGIAVGTTECISRLVVMAVYMTSDNIVMPNGMVDSIGFIATSLLLPLIGYFASFWKGKEEHVEI